MHSKTILEIKELDLIDIESISNYWLSSNPSFLENIGVDIKSLPNKEQFSLALKDQIDSSYQNKTSYCLILKMDGRSVGHCNVNKIIFGIESCIHLHIWDDENRKKGLGSQFLNISLPIFFRNLELQTIYCEPKFDNIGINKTLEGIGFVFQKQYMTVPGNINYEQKVNRWKLEKSIFLVKQLIKN